MEEFMDVDGIEFINQVNQEIASLRAHQTNSYQSPHGDSLSNLLSNESQYNHSSQAQFQPLASPTGLEEPGQVIVLDTNFLISHLGYLQSLLTKAALHPKVVTLVVPWAVVRELDGLKMSSKQKTGGASLGELVRTVMRFLERELRNKTPCLRGQKSYEIYDQKTKNGLGDDSILDCCMYFMHNLSKPVTLFSNDRNLSIKAMIHGIDAVSSETKTKMDQYLACVSKGVLPILNVEQPKPRTLQESKWTPKPKHVKPKTRPIEPQPIQNHSMEIDYGPPIEHVRYIDEDIDMLDEDTQSPENGEEWSELPKPSVPDNIISHPLNSLDTSREDRSIWTSKYAPNQNSRRNNTYNVRS
ncbi:PIN domain-containing protein [Phycomyces nitens]|nr:PIN domain-containing protein [Phycomyces nitens]